jgi:hypothetical protein
MRTWTLSIGLVLSSLALGGCNTAGSYCNKACDCNGGCTDAQFDECLDFVETYQDVAADRGCSGEFDAALRCYASSDSCDDDVIEAECADEADELDACD